MNIEVEGKVLEVAKEHIDVKIDTKMITREKFTPNVIEPSFGVGRLVYCIFEHCFKIREEDAKRTYFTFPPLIAPVKTSILPLISNHEEMLTYVRDLIKIYHG